MKKAMPGVTRPWREARTTLFSAKHLREIDEEVQHSLSLSEVRSALGRTQVELADALTVSQGSLSRLEKQRDAKVSTVKAYIEALGGELRMEAWFPEKVPVSIDLLGAGSRRSRRATR